MPERSIHGARKRGSAVKVAAAFVAPYRRSLVLAVLLLILSSCCMLTLPIALGDLLDGKSAALQPASGRAGSFALLYLLVVAFGAFTALRSYVVAWLGERVALDMRSKLFRSVLQLDPGRLDEFRGGELLSRITVDVQLVQTILTSGLIGSLRAAISFIGALVMLSITSPSLTGLMLGILPLIVLPIVLLGRSVRQHSRTTQDRVAAANALATETVHALQTVQAFRLERDRWTAFDRTLATAMAAAMTRSARRAAMMVVAMVCFSSAIALVLWIGAGQVTLGQFSAGQFGRFLLYAAMLTAAVGSFGEMLGEVQRAAGAMDRIVELLNVKPVLTTAQPFARLSNAAIESIVFDNVSFSYPSKSDICALEEFSLHITRGETIALVGPSGAGKSSVLQLLLRFYDPSRGRVLIDGVDLKHVVPDEVRALFAVVGQDTILFNGSVRENIRCGRMDASDAQVEVAARRADAESFIAALPRGYATELGERGMRLSGGQRQRLAIARAILKNAPVLLLDEATSSLDSESESQVERALRVAKEGRTTLIVAHRLSTVLKADRIILMDHGRILAQGSHAELVQQHPLYAHLAALQFDLPRKEARDARSHHREIGA